MSAQETANKAVMLGVLKKVVARLDAEVRAEVTMDPGDRKAAFAGGKRIGYVTMTDPDAGFRVTDGEAFRAWVKAHRPDEIVTTESVRSSFEKAILDRGCDEQGESIPGIEWVQPASFLQVRPTPDAEAAIRAELAREGLSFAGVLDSLSVKEIES